MYKSVLILGLLISSLSFAKEANTKEKKIEDIYKDYKVKKAEFFSASVTKENIKDKLDDFLRVLNTSMEKIEKIESKSKDVLLSPEGTQLSLDIELIGPIQNLAQSQFTAEDCEDARHLNEVNTGNEASEHDLVNGVIDRLCK